jgi:23S rRNA pseudouridine1911/1915/1917 synthase
MIQRMDFIGTEQDQGKRLDIFLAQKAPGLSRSQIQRFIENGNVTVGGKKAKASQRLKTSDRVTMILPEPRTSEILGEPIPLKILYEDSHLLVVDKPAGMVVHPGAGHFSGTLVNALLHHCSDLSGIGGILRPGIVHRIDKDTSGILVVAKDDSTHRGLAEQFKKHSPTRKYIGIAWGILPEEGQIDAEIGRHQRHRQKMSIHTRKGREALTQWRTLKNFKHFTLAEFQLRTGRTHQIRVHLSSIGHPLLGDPVYGGRRRLSSIPCPYLRQRLGQFKRQALHAAELGFIHPATGESLSFRSALPEEIQEILDLLENFDK